MKIKLCIAILSMVGALPAAPHFCCPRVVKAAVVARRPAPVPFSAFAAFHVGEFSMFAAPDPQRDKGAESCAWLAEVHRWIAWRQRNPNAPSRFRNAPKSLSADPGGAVYFGPTTEPEPDPSVLGCGCEFYDSCGFWHTVFG